MENIFKDFLNNTELQNPVRIRKVFWDGSEMKIGDNFVVTMVISFVIVILALFISGWESIFIYGFLFPLLTAWIFSILLPFLYKKEKQSNLEFEKSNQKFIEHVKELEEEYELLEQNWNTIYDNIKMKMSAILYIYANKKLKDKNEFKLEDVKPFLTEEEFKILNSLDNLYNKNFNKDLKISNLHCYSGSLSLYKYNTTWDNEKNGEELDTTVIQTNGNPNQREFSKKFKLNYKDKSLKFILECVDIRTWTFYLQNYVDLLLRKYELKDLIDSSKSEKYDFVNSEEEIKSIYSKYLDINVKSGLKDEIKERLKESSIKLNKQENFTKEMNKIYL